MMMEGWQNAPVNQRAGHLTDKLADYQAACIRDERCEDMW